MLLTRFILLASILALSSQAFAKPKKKKTDVTTVADQENKKYPSAATGQEIIVEKKTSTGSYLSFGLGRALNGKIKITTKNADADSGVNVITKLDYKLEGASVFTLDQVHFNPGKVGFSIGAYTDQPRVISSAELDIGLGKTAIETKGLTFEQYGAQFNVLIAGQIPYGYLGANFGAAELKSDDDDVPSNKLRGELGGQVGLGLRLGEYLAFEGSYRITQYTKEEENLFGRYRSSLVMETAIASIKLLLH